MADNKKATVRKGRRAAGAGASRGTATPSSRAKGAEEAEVVGKKVSVSKKRLAQKKKMEAPVQIELIEDVVETVPAPARRGRRKAAAAAPVVEAPVEKKAAPAPVEEPAAPVSKVRKRRAAAATAPTPVEAEIEVTEV
ncbi:MAG: hypothetical protein ABF714_10915, partial [Novacetimonas hansenii]